MKKKESIILTLLIVCAVETVAAQKATLTQQEIEKAVADGLRAKGGEQGLYLRDTLATMLVALESDDAKSKGTETGFSLSIYTPLTWIRQQASDAAKEYRSIAVSDVTPEILEPVLRVIVYPSRPTANTEQAARWASSVQHVVLRDVTRKTVIQPIYKEPFTQGASSKEVYQGIQAKFPLDGLREVRGAGGDGEFFVTVIGTAKNSEKDFKVRKRHFERLP